jgi:predicted nucleic acid-binding protein
MIYLIDTNVIIDYLANRLPSAAMNAVTEITNSNFFISIITRVEAVGFNSGNAVVDANTKGYVNLANVFAITDDIADIAIALKRVKKMKTPDALIAATALRHNLPLLTHNLKDFTHIPNFTVIDSYTLM